LKVMTNSNNHDHTTLTLNVTLKILDNLLQTENTM